MVPLGDFHIFLRLNSFDPRLVRGDGGALDADAVPLDGFGRLDRHPVVGGVAVLHAEVVVIDLDIEKRQDQLVLDHLPDDPGHLVAVEIDDGIGDLDLGHAAGCLAAGAGWARMDWRGYRAFGDEAKGELAEGAENQPARVGDQLAAFRRRRRRSRQEGGDGQPPAAAEGDDADLVGGRGQAEVAVRGCRPCAPASRLAAGPRRSAARRRRRPIIRPSRRRVEAGDSRRPSASLLRKPSTAGMVVGVPRVGAERPASPPPALRPGRSPRASSKAAWVRHCGRKLGMPSISG